MTGHRSFLMIPFACYLPVLPLVDRLCSRIVGFPEYLGNYLTYLGSEALLRNVN
jgi:hypothetical protein